MKKSSTFLMVLLITTIMHLGSAYDSLNAGMAVSINESVARQSRKAII
jgi:hypothetical protein